ncbi:TetR/AcrR family transcriptional regulator [Amycolatopsis suaedae]|uniref:TetR family transcriptional regulator n=1 Tax=Amycolatopsis suaedae TaxID=2510978 RepID=A0A4Q7J689_9PSEU|nr:TetR/AcrR family transcriptional regulator [Amycolatopsis suaedae]RZQ61514.1 TetR family transcriptional regulator [Amycolatopsis suaedae]
MRPSSRTAILDAAVRLAERDGVGSLTLEAAAQEAGLSKGGLIYHFAGKDALMLAVVEHIIGGWEEAMLRELGKPFDEATPGERVRAYTQVFAGASASRADMEILVDSLHNEALLAPWRAMLDRWVAEPKSTVDDAAVDRVVARLAADGLWFAEATGTSGIGTRMRAAVLRRIGLLARGDRR